ncbi:MAG: glycosyltransferase family 39 protein, partial [Polyangiaceae bacterium]
MAIIRSITDGPARRGLDAVDLATLAVVVVAGLLRVPQPLHGDTLTFVHGGDVLVHGRLYADFWDIKPPGIFYFTALGGLLFGFDEVGQHLFELLYMTVTAGLALLAARTLPGRTRRFGNLAVLLAWVPHYAVGTCFFALQIEGIIGPALLASAFLGLREEKGARFASGCMAAWIIAAKQLFAPLILVFWWLSIRHRGGRAQARETAAPLLAGAVLVAVVLALPFALQGTLGEVLRTVFVYP